MKVLIVEDDKKIADNIKKGLEQEGMVVDVAYDGDDGYVFAESEEYDVVVLDVMLPGMDGVEICRKLREEDNQVPVLMLTAKGLLEDKVDGFEAGVDDYLPKPFAFTELVMRIKALGKRPRVREKEVLKIDNLELDTIKMEVRRAGKRIELSKKEFVLLEFLMRNKNQYFGQEDLVEKVWSYEAEVLANTAQVYIGYLRKKIDKAFPGRKELIKTKRGFGYKIEG